MDHMAHDEVPAAVADGAPDAAPVPLTPSQKRLRHLTDDQQQKWKKRNHLIQHELDRRASGTQLPDPLIPPERKIDRHLAAYYNGHHVRGLRVKAFNTVTGQWNMGTITSVHLRKPPGIPVDAVAARFVFAVVQHDEVPLIDRAYEVSCLERVTD